MSAPLTLILETATPQASLGLAEHGGPFFTRDFQSDRHHNALLFAPLAELLVGRSAADIGLVLAGSGPGSYSGTRVGIAAAQGVALAAGCPAVAVPSLLGVPGVGEGKECLFIGDARRDAYWTARSEGWNLVAMPATVNAAELAAMVRQASAGGVPIITLEEPGRFSFLEETGAAVLQQTPSAQGLWEAWLQTPATVREAWSALPPQPIYLKPPHITAPRRPWLTPPPVV